MRPNASRWSGLYVSLCAWHWLLRAHSDLLESAHLALANRMLSFTMIGLLSNPYRFILATICSPLRKRLTFRFNCFRFSGRLRGSEWTVSIEQFRINNFEWIPRAHWRTGLKRFDSKLLIQNSRVLEASIPCCERPHFRPSKFALNL